MNNTTSNTNEKKTTAKQALFTAIFVSLVCIGSIIFGTYMAGTVAPLIGAIVVMVGCSFALFKRFFEIRKEEQEGKAE